VGIVLYTGITQSRLGFFALIAVLPAAWIVVFILAVRNPGERRSLDSLLKRFKHQVDLATQQLNTSPAAVDQNVLQAFDKLHAEIKALLTQKKIRFTQLRRAVMHFPYPDAPQQSSRWRPPSLSELGYVIGVCEKFSPDSPFMALYKYYGEERNSDGSLGDTFTIMSASVPRAHAALFVAKVHSPIANYANYESADGGWPPAPKPDRTASLTQRRPTDATITTLATIETRATVATEAIEASDVGNNLGYALSLLGPITLLNAHGLEQNLQAIVRLPADSARPTVMPAAWARRNLRDLLTEKLEHSQVQLSMARQALQLEPQLLVAAMADASRHFENHPAQILPALTLLAEILTPQAPASRLGLISLMTELVVLIQSLPIIPAGQRIANPDVVCIEARGAETDAGFLRRVAHWVSPAVQGTKINAAKVTMTTNLTEEAFRAQLRGFIELKPGAQDQAVIDALLVALNVKRLVLHIVDGNRLLKVREHLHSPGHKASPWLLLSANPALVDLTGIEPPIQHLLWTLTGRALDAGRSDFTALHFDRWSKIIAHAQRDSAGT
jgi:hypothetical protein